MTKYEITATRYDAGGNPISAPHSTIINTGWEQYRGATSEDEISNAFKKEFDVPQRDGSEIRVDDIEKLADEVGGRR